MILVTGNRGFIGSRLANEFSDVYGIDLVDYEDVLTSYLPDNVELIYHLAAQTSVEESFNKPFNDSLNYPMTVRIAERYPDTRIIFTQSAAAIGEISSPYGLSKWASGEYLKKFHNNSVVCVLPNVYGGGNGVVDLFKGKEKVTVYGDGKQVRDFVHVDDIVKALIKARNWKIGEYFLGSGKGTSILELAEGKEIEFAPERKEIRESVLPNTTPNWKPVIEVKEYLHA